MATTSCMDLAYTQVRPRRPWRIQGPRPSMEEKEEENPAAPGRAVLPLKPPDQYNRPTTARAEQPADYRPTTGPPSVIKRCKAGAAPDVPITTKRPVLSPRQPVQPLAPSTFTSRSQRLTSQRYYPLPCPVFPPCMSYQRNNRPSDRYYRPACAQ